jgi:hypothetical protein
MVDLRNKVYIVNRLGAYHVVPTKNGKLVFNYNVPVLVDYSINPGLVAELLQNPSLSLCTVEDADRLLTPEQPKVKVVEVETTENSESVTDELTEEN